MILVNTDDIPHKKVVKSLGLVEGNTIRARNIGRDIIAVFKNMVGGEIEEYTKLLAQAREQALDRMIQMADNWCSVQYLIYNAKCGRGTRLWYRGDHGG